MSAKAGKYRLVAVRFDQIIGLDGAGRPTGYRRFDQGDVLTLDEAEAVRLTDAGAVVPADEDDADDASVDAGAAATGDSVPERPRSSSRVDLWKEYAAARGVALQGADGEDLTKDELIEAVDRLDAEGK